MGGHLETEGKSVRAHLTASRPVEAQTWPTTECFLGEPARWLPLPASRFDDGRYESTLRAGPLMARVAVHIGEAWTLPDAISRPVAWEPVHEDGSRAHPRSVPGFDGRLTLRHDDEHVLLALEGSYVPPAGRLGAVVDRAVMHRAGDATAQALLDDIIHRLCRTD